MDVLLRCEDEIQHHYARTATTNQEAWKRQQPAARTVHQPGLRTALAQRLIALATRLAPSIQEQQTVA
jgi:hypothetical protein